MPSVSAFLVQSLSNLSQMTMPSRKRPLDTTNAEQNPHPPKSKRPLCRTESYLLVPGLPSDLKPPPRPLKRQKTPVRFTPLATTRSGRHLVRAESPAATHITRHQPKALLSGSSATSVSEARVPSFRVPTPPKNESGIIVRLPEALRRGVGATTASGNAVASSSSSTDGGAVLTPRAAAVTYTPSASPTPTPIPPTTNMNPADTEFDMSSPPPPTRFIAPLPRPRLPIIQRIPPHRKSSPLAESKQKILPAFRARPPSKTPPQAAKTVCQAVLTRRLVSSPEVLRAAEGGEVEVGPKLRQQLELRKEAEEKERKAEEKKRKAERKTEKAAAERKTEKAAAEAMDVSTPTPTPTLTSKTEAADVLEKSRDKLMTRKMLDRRGTGSVTKGKKKVASFTTTPMTTRRRAKESAEMMKDRDGDVEMGDDTT